MKPPDKNALAGTKAEFKPKFKNNYKRFPAFGKRLTILRQAGEVPSNLVMIVFSWKLAREYPRVVLADDVPPKKYQFNFLAGIPVQIVYRFKDANRVNAVSEEVVKVNPSYLATFALDLVDAGEATTIIRHLENNEEVCHVHH